MKNVLLLALASAVFAISALFLVWRLTADDREEESHYDHGETELRLSLLSDTLPILYRAGKSLQDTVQISPLGEKSTWLKSGNYFLRLDDATGQYFFPIPLTGYRCGPDKDGSFVVTIRPSPREYPPSLSNELPRFRYIPSGNFLLGDRLNPREPHYIWVAGYYVTPFEVSNEEFRSFMKAPDGYGNTANWTHGGQQWKSSGHSIATALLNVGDADYKRFGRADQPVTWVNWYEANAFCKWLTNRLGDGRWYYSLPTDAEWEKAARGPDNLDYSLSMTISDNESALYNWKKNPDSPVTVIGIHESPQSYRPNRYGLYHLTGNVFEWTQSIDRPYNQQQPYMEDNRNHDDTPGLRTVRGGSWYSASIAYLYIPYRDSFQPEHSTQDTGFRIVARSLP